MHPKIRREAEGVGHAGSVIHAGRADTSPIPRKRGAVDKSYIEADRARKSMATDDGRVFLPKNLELAMRALNEALKRGGRMAPDHARVPDGVMCVSLTQWRDEWSRIAKDEDIAGSQQYLGDEAGLNERIKVARKRAVDKLLPAGFIGKDGDLVWRTSKRVFDVDYPLASIDLADSVDSATTRREADEAGHSVRGTHWRSASLTPIPARGADDQDIFEIQGAHVIGDISGSDAGAGGQRGRVIHSKASPSNLSPDALDGVIRDVIAGNGEAGGQARNETHRARAAGQNSPQGGDEANCRVETMDKPPRRKSSRASGSGRTIQGTNTTRVPSARKPSRRKADAGDQVRQGNQEPSVSGEDIDDQTSIATQRPGVVEGDLGHIDGEDQKPNAEVANTIAEIRMLWRRRRQWHRAEKSLTLQCSAICRGSAPEGDKRIAGKILKRIEENATEPGDIYAEIACAPLLAARNAVREQRLAIDKTLGKLGKTLPIASWGKSVYGFGDLGLAAIVGEAGDVGSYRNPSCLWKRMGLAVIGDERQRMKSGDAALEHGYSPDRRSVMWNIGGGLIGGMGRGPRPAVGEDIALRDDLSPYQKLFVTRLRYEADRDPEAHRKAPVVNAKTGELRESFSAHAANRAKRYVEKRFLRDMFSAWRAVARAADPSYRTPGQIKDIEMRREARRRAAIGVETDILLPAATDPASAGGCDHEACANQVSPFASHSIAAE